MRVKITFLVAKNSAFSINYNYFLSSLIYKTLERSSAKFSLFLHDQGFELDGRHFKLFTFSQLLFSKKRIAADKIINLAEKVEWFISSPVDEFIRHFVNGLFESQNIRLADIAVIPETVETVVEPQFSGNDKFTCFSPITMSTRVETNGKLKARYLDFNEPLFTEKIRDNLIKKYRLIHGKEPENTDFGMVFDQEYVKVNKRVSRLIKFKGIDIRGYMLPFVVNGNAALTKIGYGCGFGDKNSAGFGMVKLADSKGKLALEKACNF